MAANMQKMLLKLYQLISCCVKRRMKHIPSPADLMFCVPALFVI